VERKNEAEKSRNNHLHKPCNPSKPQKINPKQQLQDIQKSIVKKWNKHKLEEDEKLNELAIEEKKRYEKEKEGKQKIAKQSFKKLINF
jgi:hypothetical protein